MYSFNREQSVAIEGHNIVAVIMAEQRLGIQAAMDHAGMLYHKLTKEFLEGMEQLPEDPAPENKLVREYVEGCRRFVVTNNEWSFAGGRFFGPQASEIRESRRVDVYPKQELLIDPFRGHFIVQ